MSTIKLPLTSSTYISEYRPTCNFSDSSYLDIGCFCESKSTSKTYLNIGLLEIPLSSITNIENLENIKLILSIVPNESNLSRKISFQLGIITSPYDTDTVSWNTELSIKKLNKWYKFDHKSNCLEFCLTDLIDNVVYNHIPMYGIALIPNCSTYRFKIYSCCGDCAPYLLLDYCSCDLPCNNPDCVCPPGPTGPQGPQGEPGPQGERGPQGEP